MNIKNLFKSKDKKPDRFADLDFIGKDKKGRKYYAYPNLEDLPMVRFTKGECFRLMDDNKLDAETLAIIVDKINELVPMLASEKKNNLKGRYAAQINALSNELLYRANFLTPESVLLNIAATLSIREDEKPESWNDTVHNEKIKDFEQLLNDGNDFFFQSQAFKGFKASLIMSTEDWTKHIQKLRLQKDQLEQRLKIILSKASSSEKSSENKN
jgi:hypothetical protein